MPLSSVDVVNDSTFNDIDKIVYENEISIVNDGNAPNGPQTAKVVEQRIANPYGRACLLRARWSIDNGASWQGLESELLYLFTFSSVPGNPGHPISTTLSGLNAAISVGSSDTEIVFITANGHHGNVTNTVTPVYTPTSYTFRIQYTLYEVA